MSAVAVSVLVFLFLVVTVLGFAAARWRRADLDNLDEWGLGGRGFGTFISWFLIGGDLYTAYTFIAVPATLYAGSVVGFFAVPYTIVVYPLIFLFLPRLWSVSHRHGYVTPADFVEGRYGSRSLGLAVALTGILATAPYIALQLVGIQSVLQVAGFGGSGGWFVKDLPLFIAFAVLAAYTYSSGLRAPALIAFVKDILIYVVIIVAVIYLPHKLGGWGHIFSAANGSFTKFNSDNATAIASGQAAGKGLMPPPTLHWAYASLALGSALALFMYPHSVTGVLSTRNRGVIRRNAALLPAYSFLLGLLALLGFIAVAAGVTVAGNPPNPQLAVPQLFENEFPAWFAGVGYAAIAIGALVPAAIMSIAAANLFTRNIYKAYFRPGATPGEEAQVSKIASLVVKVGALVFVLALSKSFAINLQLLGGVWILQTFPAIVVGLYTRWLHRWAVLAGWAAGMAYGTWTAYGTASPIQAHFGSPLAEFPGTSTKIYIAATAFLVNLLVTVVLTVVLRAMKVDPGVDQTTAPDYVADLDDPGVQAEIDPHAPAHA
jgi:solute:Na+ symporter, SSS family